MDIEFDLLKNEIFNLLGDSLTMVLATCSDNKVTARNMSCIIIDTKIYFQTDKTFIKYKQMIENSNVALCKDNIQIEGIAKIKGHPFNEENKEFSRIYEKSYKGSYDTYSHMSNEVVVEVQPTFITMWKYKNGQPFRDFLDIQKNKAYREFYNTNI